MKGWRERIHDARARGVFTPQDIMDAADWSTCAYGEQMHRYPGFVTHDPLAIGGRAVADRWRAGEGDIFMDAVRFSPAVRTHNFDRAEQLLTRIEDAMDRAKRGHEEAAP